MTQNIKVALIGLDTSHTIEFAKRMQAPDCPADQHVPGLRAVTCLRFATPFQNEAGLNARQKQLEGWGITVTTDFAEAVADCDAVMIEINDPARHLEYFTYCADLGKRIFLDKPLANTIANGRQIAKLAAAGAVPVFSSSSLRFVPQLQQACATLPAPVFTTVYGPLGQAPAGSSLVWYGVHAFEMLERAMGRGAQSVVVQKDDAGVTAIVHYPNRRRGIVELSDGAWVYGGCLRDKQQAVPFVADAGRLNTDLLVQVTEFFRGGPAPVALTDTLEVMALLDATQRAYEGERIEPVTP
jgi:predicted dehydrogenase